MIQNYFKPDISLKEFCETLTSTTPSLKEKVLATCRALATSSLEELKKALNNHQATNEYLEEASKLRQLKISNFVKGVNKIVEYKVDNELYKTYKKAGADYKDKYQKYVMSSYKDQIEKLKFNHYMGKTPLLKMKSTLQSVVNASDIVNDQMKSSDFENCVRSCFFSIYNLEHQIDEIRKFLNDKDKSFQELFEKTLSLVKHEIEEEEKARKLTEIIQSNYDTLSKNEAYKNYKLNKQESWKSLKDIAQFCSYDEIKNYKKLYVGAQSIFGHMADKLLKNS